MEFTAAILSPAILWLGSLIYAAGVLFALAGAPWSWLRRGEVANRFAASCVAVLMVWQVRADLDGGPSVHLLGATLLTLAFGWRLAIVALSIVLVSATLIGPGEWRALGANGTLLVLVAVAVSYGVARATESLLPRHLFVYIFVSAFFGAAITVATVSFAALGIVWLADVMNAHALSRNYLPTAWLLLFPEAFVTGALVTLAAIYRPRWLASYDEPRYLADHRGD